MRVQYNNIIVLYTIYDIRTRLTKTDEIVSFEFDLVSSKISYYYDIIVVIIVIVPCWSLRLAFNCFASEKKK